MHTQESEALADMLRTIKVNEKDIKNDNTFLGRSLMDNLVSLSAEPTEVCYESSKIAGLECIWAIPRSADPSSKSVILYFHGGGSHRKIGGHLAKAAGARLCLIHYRRSPEHVFPSQIEDAVSAYKYLLSHGHPANSIAFAGDSSGGNLSITATLKALQDGLEPPAAIIAFSPWLDMLSTGESVKTNADTDAFAGAKMLESMIPSYIPDDSIDKKQPLLSPIYTAPPRNFPACHLVVGASEVLMSDTDRWAELCKKSGVECHVDKVEGQQHVHVFMAGKAKEADDSLTSAGIFLKEKLSG